MKHETTEVFVLWLNRVPFDERSGFEWLCVRAEPSQRQGEGGREGDLGEFTSPTRERTWAWKYEVEKAESR